MQSMYREDDEADQSKAKRADDGISLRLEHIKHQTHHDIHVSNITSSSAFHTRGWKPSSSSLRSTAFVPGYDKLTRELLYPSSGGPCCCASFFLHG